MQLFADNFSVYFFFVKKKNCTIKNLRLTLHFVIKSLMLNPFGNIMNAIASIIIVVVIIIPAKQEAMKH